jgi:acetyl esterase/lipase
VAQPVRSRRRACEIPADLLLHRFATARDALLAQVRTYAADDWSAHSGPLAEYLEYAGAAHAFLNFPDTQPVAWRAIQDIAGYLRGS